MQGGSFTDGRLTLILPGALAPLLGQTPARRDRRNRRQDSDSLHQPVSPSMSREARAI